MISGIQITKAIPGPVWLTPVDEYHIKVTTSLTGLNCCVTLAILVYYTQLTRNFVS